MSSHDQDSQQNRIIRNDKNLRADLSDQPSKSHRFYLDPKVQIGWEVPQEHAMQQVLEYMIFLAN